MIVLQLAFAARPRLLRNILVTHQKRAGPEQNEMFFQFHWPCNFVEGIRVFVSVAIVGRLWAQEKRGCASPVSFSFRQS
jgi:hypothetical protein